MAKKLIKEKLEKFLSKMSTKDTKQEVEEQEVNNEATTEENIEQAETTEASAIEKLEQENKDLNDKFLRLFSDFDNFRKRTAKEKLDIRKKAGVEVIKDLLTVVDDFDRANENNKNVEDIETMREGFKLIHNKLSSILKAKGLTEIDAKGEVFDVDKHEAITQIPAPSEDLKGRVVDVIEKGYALNDVVIRFPKVIVGV